MTALGAQLGCDRIPFGFGFRAGELGEQAVDPRLGVLQFFAGGDGGRGDVVGRLVAGADLVDRGEGGQGVAEPGAGDQQLEVGAGIVLARAGRRVQDDAVGVVDGGEDLGRVVGDVGGLGEERDLGGAFDLAVA